jgi:GT2 family glycosyltransferase
MTPDVSVVVASHDRPLRLRWLLNALEEQTLPREAFEVVVVHDSSGPETEALLREHPLAAAGVLRHRAFAPGPGPAAKRNTGWREARAPLVAFTDDDCRPPAAWLERLLAAARANRGTIVQGTTAIDPDEAGVRHASPHARSQEVLPPTPFGQTCNIAYPRAVLEELGGFDEEFPLAAGEDTDLLLRARRAGVPLVAAPEAVTYHAVEGGSLAASMRAAWRWQHLALVVKRHPALRHELTARLFWKPAHAWLPLALAGAAVARRRPLLGAALALPWALTTRSRYGRGPHGIARALAELPQRALLDATEMAAMGRGALRYRTVLL